MYIIIQSLDELFGQGAKFVFALESSSFCYLGAHTKFHNPSCLPSGRKAMASEEEENSTHANGGPRSHVRPHGTLR